MNNNGRVRVRVKDPNVLSVPAPPPGGSMGGSSEDDDCPLEVEGPLLPVAEEPKEAGVPLGAPTFWMLSGRLHRCVKLPTSTSCEVGSPVASSRRPYELHSSSCQTHRHVHTTLLSHRFLRSLAIDC